MILEFDGGRGWQTQLLSSIRGKVVMSILAERDPVL